MMTITALFQIPFKVYKYYSHDFYHAIDYPNPNIFSS